MQCECSTFLLLCFQSTMSSISKMLKSWCVISTYLSGPTVAQSIQSGHPGTHLLNISFSLPIAHSMEPCNLDSVLKIVSSFGHELVESLGEVPPSLCTADAFSRVTPTPALALRAHRGLAMELEFEPLSFTPMTANSILFATSLSYTLCRLGHVWLQKQNTHQQWFWQWRNGILTSQNCGDG